MTKPQITKFPIGALWLFTIAASFGFGVYYYPSTIYKINDQVIFNEGACEETGDLRRGAVTYNWRAIDASENLYFSNFHHMDGSHRCDEFYKMFHKEEK